MSLFWHMLECSRSWSVNLLTEDRRVVGSLEESGKIHYQACESGSIAITSPYEVDFGRLGNVEDFAETEMVVEVRDKRLLTHHPP